jgi:hypothetical protein
VPNIILLRQHDAEDAALRAAMRADELLARSDVEGAGVWRRIGRAIAALAAIVSASGPGGATAISRASPIAFMRSRKRIVSAQPMSVRLAEILLGSDEAMALLAEAG